MGVHSGQDGMKDDEEHAHPRCLHVPARLSPLCRMFSTPSYLTCLHSFFEMQLQSHFLQEAL